MRATARWQAPGVVGFRAWRWQEPGVGSGGFGGRALDPRILREPMLDCGEDTTGPEIDEERRKSVTRHAQDAAEPSLEMRESDGMLTDMDALPDIEAAFPPPPPPPILRPVEYEQNYSLCFLACTGVQAQPSECIACGNLCPNSMFGTHARCGDCGASFCGDCKATGLRKLRGSAFACEDSSWRCVDSDACENQPHSLRMVRSFWGPENDDDDDDDMIFAPRPSEEPPSPADTVTI